MNIKCDYGYQSFETGFHDFADEYFVYKSSKTADFKKISGFLYLHALNNTRVQG